ncbi:MAG: hypothetical protein VKJ46_08585, partial [Leptolyngbyaceae bacterium]|nr:hypothetical protein [Leptolyngbyaceae bacterium]
MTATDVLPLSVGRSVWTSKLSSLYQALSPVLLLLMVVLLPQPTLARQSQISTEDQVDLRLKMELLAQQKGGTNRQLRNLLQEGRKLVDGGNFAGAIALYQQ